MARDEEPNTMAGTRRTPLNGNCGTIVNTTTNHSYYYVGALLAPAATAWRVGQ